MHVTHKHSSIGNTSIGVDLKGTDGWVKQVEVGRIVMVSDAEVLGG